MFVDRASKENYDVVIVGAGPAGISLALRISEQGDARILLIESGMIESVPKIGKLSEVEAMGDLSSSYYPVHAQRIFGGTSRVWAGYCTVLERRAFENHDWPIAYESIEPYYKIAAGILDLPEGAYKRPVKNILDNSTLLYKPYYLSPPVRFNQKYHVTLQEHKSIDVMLNSTCENIYSDRGTVNGLLVAASDGSSSSKVKIKARRYILACGGIGNATILQLAGVASESPVGRYFMEHPHIYDAGSLEINREAVMPILEQGNVVHALTLSDSYCLENDLLNFTVSFSTDVVESRVFLGRKRDLYPTRAVIRAEMLPDIKNRVLMSSGDSGSKEAKPKIWFHFNYQNLAAKSWNAFSEALLSSGLGRATTHAAPYPRITGGGHYIGTTRMGNEPRASVVDSNCRVHHTDNLYVVGSSIFPAGSAANPTYSIVAFALRLADHLSSEV